MVGRVTVASEWATPPTAGWNLTPLRATLRPMPPKKRADTSALSKQLRSQEHFGNRLRIAREAAGLTQQGEADALDVSKVTVSRWERGLAMPNPVTTAQLCKLLRVEPNWLLEGLA